MNSDSQASFSTVDFPLLDLLPPFLFHLQPYLFPFFPPLILIRHSFFSTHDLASLILLKWADCNLAGALGLLRILIYTTYSDGKTTMFVHEKQASIKEFYGVIFPSLLQLQTGVTEFEARKQKELCSSKYRRYGLHERREFTKLEKELEEECGICMEMNAKVVLPNCCHSLCFKCYQDCLRSDCTFFLQ